MPLLQDSFRTVHPFVGRVKFDEHLPSFASENPKVINGVSRRGGNWMVAARNDNSVAVLDDDCFVQLAVVSVNHLDCETRRREDAEVVNLFHLRLKRRVLFLVFVGRIRRPVARRISGLTDKQAAGREGRVNDVVNIATPIEETDAPAFNLVWSYEGWFAARRGWDCPESQFNESICSDAEAGV